MTSPKTWPAYAAFRYGRLLYGIIDTDRDVVERYQRACYAQEVRMGLHTSRDVLKDHGIEIRKILITET